jgi:hypothetical protein
MQSRVDGSCLRAEGGRRCAHAHAHLLEAAIEATDVPLAERLPDVKEEAHAAGLLLVLVKRAEDVLIARGLLALMDVQLDRVVIEREVPQRHRVEDLACELNRPHELTCALVHQRRPVAADVLQVHRAKAVHDVDALWPPDAVGHIVATDHFRVVPVEVQEEAALERLRDRVDLAHHAEADLRTQDHGLAVGPTRGLRVLLAAQRRHYLRALDRRQRWLVRLTQLLQAAITQLCERGDTDALVSHCLSKRGERLVRE